MGRQETPWIDISNQFLFFLYCPVQCYLQVVPWEIGCSFMGGKRTPLCFIYYLPASSHYRPPPPPLSSYLSSLSRQKRTQCCRGAAAWLSWRLSKCACHGNRSRFQAWVTTCCAWADHAVAPGGLNKPSHSSYRHQYHQSSPFLLWSVSNLWLSSAGHWLYLCVFCCYLHVPISVQPTNQWGTQLPAWRQTQMCGPPAMSCCHTTTPHSLWTEYRTIQEIAMSAKPPESTQYIP